MVEKQDFDAGFIAFRCKFRQIFVQDLGHVLFGQTCTCVTCSTGQRETMRRAFPAGVTPQYGVSQEPPDGGPVVLQIESRDEAGPASRVWIHITDQGIGMTALQCSRVCERFYRADASGKVPGTGLGMRIVKEILDMHGGELAISSSPGLGTRISMSLPF